MVVIIVERDRYPDTDDRPEHEHGDPGARHSTAPDDEQADDRASKDDSVEEASRDSFPTSDAPAW
jgi:hypothetical protein